MLGEKKTQQKVKKFNTETIWDELIEPLSSKISNHSIFLFAKYKGMIKVMLEGVIEGHSIFWKFWKKVIISTDTSKYLSKFFTVIRL